IQAIRDSSARLRAILPASALAAPGMLSLVVRTNGFNHVAPDSPPVPVSVDAPGPAPVSIAISGSVATASHLTPGGNSAWLLATVIRDGSTTLNNDWIRLLGDPDSDGVVSFNTAAQPAPLPVIPPLSVAAVVDLATGALRADVPPGGTRKELFFPYDAVRGMKNGAVTSLMTGAYSLAVFVRPGVGAWSATNVPATPYSTALFAPIAPGMPPVPPTFTADDIIVAVSYDSFTSARLGDYIPAADPAVPAFSIDDATVVEGNSGTSLLGFDVHLSSVAASRVTVQYSLGQGTAREESDYQAVSGILTFEPGDLVKTFVVPVYGDTLSEADETLQATLAAAYGAPILFGTARGTILDDDPLPAISIGDASSVEGTHQGATAMSFPVTLSAPSGQDIQVRFRYVSITADESDVMVLPTDFFIPAGATSITLMRYVDADTIDEDDETFALEIESAWDAAIGRGRAIGTIVNDDAPPTLTVPPVSVVEGTGADRTIDVPMLRLGLSGKPMSIDYQLVANSAGANDFVVASGSVHVGGAANAPNATIPVTIRGDAIPEGAESFSIVFSHPVNVTAPAAATTVTVADDDGPPGSYAAAVLRDQPEVYYRLDEAEGSIARDLSSHGRNGVYTNVARNLAGALGSGNPGVLLNYSGSLASPGNWGGADWTEATEELWMFVDGPYGRTNAFPFQSSTPLHSFLSLYIDDSGTWAHIVADGAFIQLHVARPSPGWHHIVLAAKSGASALYIDGVPVAGSTVPFTALSTNAGMTTGGFNMQIDELAIYKKALTPADVTRHFTLRADAHTAGDFDGNGSSDLVLRNQSTGANALWLMNGTSYASTVNLDWLPSAFRIDGSADFDGDGQPDLLLRNYTNGNNALWLMNGTAVKAIVNLPWLPIAADFRFEGTADMNGDGWPDLLIRNYSNGNNAVWLMNGTSFAGVANLPALPDPNYRMAGAGDFNGDGKPDIVWRNQVTGNNAVWLMDGLTQLSIANLPALPNTAYRINAIADYDGDGSPDLVLRNYTNGANAIWLLSGVTAKATVNLPALPNTAYEIMGPR
ncbi:MAG: hypothetical protein JWO56_3664, partial [Acidobacteria bacterium]|nr:hypothetical protein [Acidobacteriota bacterium]